MPEINLDEWTKKLKAQGFDEVFNVPISAGFDSEEHTHDEDTIHVILKGELIVVDQDGKHTYKPGDVVEFPSGTTHRAFGGANEGSMIVGIRYTDLPKIGRPATQALQAEGVNKLFQLTEWTEEDLKDLHGVGPKAIKILKEAFAEKGWSFKQNN